MLPRPDGILGVGGPAAQSAAAPVALRPPATRRSTALATTVTAVLSTAVRPPCSRPPCSRPQCSRPPCSRPPCSRRRDRVVCVSTVLQRHGRRFHGGWFHVTELMGGGGGWQRRRGDISCRRRACWYAPGLVPSRCGGATCAAPAIPRLHARPGGQQAPQVRAWSAQYSAGLLRRGWPSPSLRPAGV